MLYRDLGRIIQTPSRFMNLWKHPHSLENISPTLISKIQTRDEGGVYCIHTFEIWNLKFKISSSLSRRLSLSLSLILPLSPTLISKIQTRDEGILFILYLKLEILNLPLSLSRLCLSLSLILSFSLLHIFPKIQTRDEGGVYILLKL